MMGSTRLILESFLLKKHMVRLSIILEPFVFGSPSEARSYSKWARSCPFLVSGILLNHTLEFFSEEEEFD